MQDVNAQHLAHASVQIVSAEVSTMQGRAYKCIVRIIDQTLCPDVIRGYMTLAMGVITRVEANDKR